MTLRQRGSTLLTAAAVLLFAVSGFAQQLSLSGTIRDADGVIADAAITLRQTGSEPRTATTDKTGAYKFTGLAAGSYELSVVMRGFETAVRNISLASDPAPVDVVLSLGRVSTTLTVTATAGKATASRLPVANDDIPAQVSSIPQELMRQQGTNTVMDALKNASGVRAVRWYGAYEQYLVRGFFDPDRDDSNVVLLDGMHMSGNRYSTQSNNIQSIEVLKGPSSILYGRGAAGGAINLIRKQPESVRAHEVSYRGGRFNTHQVSASTTGPLGKSSRLLYRADMSFEDSDGWRNAGAKRFNLTPSLIWLVSDKMRLSIHETFNRDHFDADGGVPFDMVNHPSYKPSLRFDLPQDNVLVKDSQTQVLFNGQLSSNWEIRNSFLVQHTNDRYFVTEYLYSDDDLVWREPLDFHHHRTPVQNQTELVGRLSGFGRHNLLFGYEYQGDRGRSDTTAGDDPDCLCGYWWMTIEPIDITTMKENQTPLDIDTIARETDGVERTNSVYWQDQIDVIPQLKINVGGRYDKYYRSRKRTYLNDPSLNGFREISEDATTYRAGVVYAPGHDHQLYFSTASSFSFNPWDDTPGGVTTLKPRTGRNYEIGHRWRGVNGRVETNLAFYHIVRNNQGFATTATTFVQVGKQRSRGMEVDVNTELGARTHLLLNYGFTEPRFLEADDLSLTGKTPRYVPKHNANAWLRKDWKSGFNTGIGAHYMGAQFFNNSNSLRSGGYTIISGAIGYRAERWDWSLNAENLFNRQRYFLPGNYTGMTFPGQPINVTSSIRFRFS